jgi:hypothetical protein
LTTQVAFKVRGHLRWNYLLKNAELGKDKNSKDNGMGGLQDIQLIQL